MNGANATKAQSAFHSSDNKKEKREFLCKFAFSKKS